MAIEIERKFLVSDSATALLTDGVVYAQAYLDDDPDKTIRVRIAGEKAYLTIKGRTEGYSRLELEYEIPVPDAHQLFTLCRHAPVVKTRYILLYKGNKWEIDVFQGVNDGLVIAEIELTHENESFEIPPWITEEVTQDFRYYNSYLYTHPYESWK